MTEPLMYEDPSVYSLVGLADDLQGVVPAWLGFVLDGAVITPGETVGFAWIAAPQSGARWVSVDLEITLIVGGQEEHVWDRRHITWPPRVVTAADTDGIWPPVGYVADVLQPIGGARLTLYQGLGMKQLKLILTARNAEGGSTTMSTESAIEVIAPTGALTVNVDSPRQAEWNSPYTVHAGIVNNTYAAVTCQIQVTSSDGMSFQPVGARAGAHTVSGQNIAGPIVQTWEWVDKPTYHVRTEQLRRVITYTPSIGQLVDEFGNPYPDAPQRSAAITVTVPQNKIHDANLSETNWWISTGLAANSAVTGVLAAIPILTPFLAPVSAGSAGEAIYFGGVAAMYAQSADDPPEPDPEYWIIAPVPLAMPEPKEEKSPALSRLVRGLHRLARCQLAISSTVGKYLGARLAGDQLAEQLHLAQSKLIADAAAHELRIVIDSLPQACVEVVADDSLAPDNVVKDLTNLAQNGISDQVRDALDAQLGKVYGSALAQLLTDPTSSATIPPLEVSLRRSVYQAHGSLRANLTQLGQLLDLSAPNVAASTSSWDSDQVGNLRAGTPAS